MADSSVGHSGQSLCFLSLDGGGVRGLSTLYILKAMVECIDPDDPPKPCDLFDMIGGTSTGGLIALMLGRLGMTVDECIEAYKAMSPQIFTKIQPPVNIRGKVQGRFDHIAIEAAVKHMLRNKGLRGDALLQETSSSSTKTKQTGRTALFRTYHQKGRSDDLSEATTIWQAARATSAATSFFDPIEIGNEGFVDGATPANNPIMELWAEAWDYFSPEDNASWDLDDNISCLVSIGTGIPTIRPFGDNPVSIGAKLVKIATDTENSAEAFTRHHPKLHSPQRYFRFNVTRGLEGVGLEEHNKVKEIIGATRKYIESFEASRMLMKCSASLGQTHQLSASYDIALANSQDHNIQSFFRNTLSLSTMFNMAPTSDLLAWFTNTKNYRNWVESKGGCLYYPVTHRTSQGFGETLRGALAASWTTFPPPTIDGPVKVAYVDCSHTRSRAMNDIVQTLVCQVLIHLFPEKGSWLHMIAQARSQERRLMAANLNEASLGTLFGILRFLLQSTPFRVDATLLFIVNNIHNLQSNPEAEELLQTRTEMERMGIFLFVTGQKYSSMTMRDWGASTLASVDEETEYLELLESLKFDDMFTRRNQVSNALTGTNEWLLENEAFTKWTKSPAGLLWIQGKPGSGKSVLAKSALDKKFRPSDNTIMASWFYSKRGGSAGMSHDSMMRSITYQLLSQCSSLFNRCRTPYRQHSSIRDIFDSLLDPSIAEDRLPGIMCLFDGLDETEDRDGDVARDILCLLAKLARPGSRLKVLVLSRPYKTIQKVYGTYDILLEAENRTDIDKIINSGCDLLSRTIHNLANETITSFGHARRMRLEDGLDTELKRSSDALDNTVSESSSKEAEAVRAYLKENARGVTLWVTLSLQQITRFASRGPCTWAVVQRLLRRLPLELDQMYDAIVRELMTDCDQEHILMARKVLAWVMIASTRRPLLFRELRDAMSIPDDWKSSGVGIDESRDPLCDNRPFFSTWTGLCYLINAICGPLVEFVNPSDVGTLHYDRLSKVTGSSVVQLVHQTAKDFLEQCQNHMFGFRPDEARLFVHDQGLLYLRLVIPLSKATYAPYLHDFSDNWEATVRDCLQYLDDKHLLPFVLVYCNIHAEDLILAASSDTEDWRLSAFFKNMQYKDLQVSGVVEKTVVGLLYRLGCNMGMDVAVGNLLFLTSLRSGWWSVHRAAVLRAVSVTADSSGNRRLGEILTMGKYRLNKPALRFDDRDIPGILSEVITRPSTQIAYGPDDPERDFSIPQIPELSQVGDENKVKMAISRVIHFLLGNLQPVELVGVDFYDEMGLAFERATPFTSYGAQSTHGQEARV